MPAPEWVGPAIEIGGPAVLDYVGQRQTNAQNLAIAREQMSFQERMSSTAYQRATQDMRAAGINPMLAYQQGGASSPGGASARMENALGGAVATAQQARRMKADLKLLMSQDRLTRTRTRAERQAIAESESRESLNYRNVDMSLLQRSMLSLQMPQLLNAARVQSGRFGAGAAFLERFRQSLFGGGAAVRPLGGR